MAINGNNNGIMDVQQAYLQFLQALQQNGQVANAVPQVPNQPMNWNIPTNPMAAMWMNNMADMYNAQNMNQQQMNQNNQPVQKTQERDNTDPAVRIVNSPEEIKADEIPMNGSIRLFLQDDMNVIYGKRWTNNGIIENIRFVREDEVNNKETKPIAEDTFIDMNEFANRISKMMDDKLEKFRKEYVDNTNNGSKEEVKDNGE